MVAKTLSGKKPTDTKDRSPRSESALEAIAKRSPFLLRPITLVPPAAQIFFKRVLSYLATSTIFNCSIRRSIRRTKKHSVRLATRWDLVDRYRGKATNP